jgi:ATP-dependent helicase Lhr and Lhr-like helicase
VVPPPLPAHLFAQQTMALSLQLSGVSRPEIGAWLGTAVEATPEAERAAILDHMLATGILSEDAGVLGLGPKGEREFGRRHFSDLVAAFSEPLLLLVRYGQADLGTVHPASLASRRSGEPIVLLLGGRSWKVTSVDWQHRAITVVPFEDVGRSRWLGSSRVMSEAVCRMMERIVAGREPGCRLSRRAEAALAQTRDRLAFVDGDTLPVVSQGGDRVVVWAFAGGAATASIAAGLAFAGIRVIDFDDLSITLRVRDPEQVARALRRIDPISIYPKLPDDLGPSLKFGLCLPAGIIESVLKARTSDAAAVAAACHRPARLISVAQIE